MHQRIADLGTRNLNPAHRIGILRLQLADSYTLYLLFGIALCLSSILIFSIPGIRSYRFFHRFLRHIGLQLIVLVCSLLILNENAGQLPDADSQYHHADDQHNHQRDRHFVLLLFSVLDRHNSLLNHCSCFSSFYQTHMERSSGSFPSPAQTAMLTGSFSTR